MAGLSAAACSGVKDHYPNGRPSILPPEGSGGSGSGDGSGGSAGSTGGGTPGRGGSSGGTPTAGSSGGPGNGGTSGGGTAGNTGSATGGSSGGSIDAGPGGGAGTGGGGQGPGPGPAPSGSTIEIGGKQLPSDKVVVFIHIGTSNMGGRAQEPRELFDYFMWYGKSIQPGGQPDPAADPNPLPYSPRLWMFTKEGKFVPAREPTASDESGDAGAGPGMGLMRAAENKWKEHTFVSIGRGQSGQRGGFCAHFLEHNLINGQPWSTVPPKTQEDVAGNRAYGFYNEVMNLRALKLKGKVIFGGIVVMFGSTEDRTGAPVPSPPAVPYLSQCLIKLASTYRAALGDPNIPFLITDFDHGAGEYAYNGPLGTKCASQIRIAQQMIPRSEIIPTDKIQMRDDHHYTMQGHKTWGDTIVDIIDKNGWAPWAAP